MVYFKISQFHSKKNSHLPLENWVDLFGFLPRRKLVQLLPQICDREFAEAIQYFLLKIGKITLSHLAIFPPRQSDGNGRPKMENICTEQQVEMAQADTTMPGNIKDFLSIRLRFIPLINSDF
jgi:hypothetical protein